MRDRFVIIKHNAGFYQRATKKVKSQMIKELSEGLHMNKQYIASLLRNAGKAVARKGRYSLADQDHTVQCPHMLTATGQW